MADAVDDDTLQAVLTRWLDDSDLAGLLPRPPQTGRLKSTPETRQVLPYGQLDCVLERREQASTSGAYFDWRRVTMTVRGTREQAVRALELMTDRFGFDTTLVYPSGARFMRWKSEDGGKLEEDPETREGEDLWQAILTGLAWSVR